MQITDAAEIAESVGCFFRFDELMNWYTVYVGQSMAHIKAKDLEKLETDQYKKFLINFMQQEAEDILKYGIVVH